MKNFLRNIGSIAIALSFVSSAHGMMTPTSGAACAMEEHIQEKTFNITIGC